MKKHVHSQQQKFVIISTAHMKSSQTKLQTEVRLINNNDKN